jgi:hypothetical protein
VHFEGGLSVGRGEDTPTEHEEEYSEKSERGLPKRDGVVTYSHGGVEQDQGRGDLQF